MRSSSRSQISVVVIAVVVSTWVVCLVDGAAVLITGKPVTGIEYDSGTLIRMLTWPWVATCFTALVYLLLMEYGVATMQGTRKSGPSFCWWCGKDLHPVAGKPGLVHFELVKDRMGHVHRVHSDCEKDALEDGCLPVKIN